MFGVKEGREGGKAEEKKSKHRKENTPPRLWAQIFSQVV